MNLSREGQFTDVPGGASQRLRNSGTRFRTALCLIITLGSAALGADSWAPSYTSPWAPPHLDQYEAELAAESARPNPGAVLIDPRKIYDLPELIDLAQRNNPATRIAWERARQAAAAVGLGESTYYPYLVASAGAGYERAFLPFPSLTVNQTSLVTQLVRAVPGAAANPAAALHALETKNLNLTAPKVSITGGGSLIADTEAANATLSVKWLLLDFGERRALVDAAKERLMMANVGFNAAHQQIVFEVTRSFYAFGNAREQVAVAMSALRAATTVEQAVKARLDHGLAIKPEWLQAQQQTAQFEYQLAAAEGADSDARAALFDSLGILPTSDLQVADYAADPLPLAPAESVDALIDLALSQRTDLVIQLANLRASQAEVRAARAAYYPKVSVEGHVADSALDVSIDDSSYFGGTHPTYGAAVTVDLPIFDGFQRLQQLRIAETDLHSAESALDQTRDTAAREVWKAYTDFKTALHQQEAAAKLLTASQDAYASVLESYRNGLSTYVEVVNSERDVASARGIGLDARAAIFTSAAALALSIGDLANPAPHESAASQSYQR